MIDLVCKSSIFRTLILLSSRQESSIGSLSAEKKVLHKCNRIQLKAFTLAIYSSRLMRCFIIGIPSILTPESVAISFAIARVVSKMPFE